MPVSLVALKKLTYAWQTYTAGEVFEARDDADAMVLKMTHLADDAPSQDALQPVPVPEPVDVDDTEGSPAPRRRRAYRRRVLPAET